METGEIVKKLKALNSAIEDYLDKLDMEAVEPEDDKSSKKESK